MTAHVAITTPPRGHQTITLTCPTCGLAEPTVRYRDALEAARTHNTDHHQKDNS